MNLDNISLTRRTVQRERLKNFENLGDQIRYDIIDRYIGSEKALSSLVTVKDKVVRQIEEDLNITKCRKDSVTSPDI